MFLRTRRDLRFDLLTAVLLVALFLRGVTPAGYMPGEGPMGLKLCTAAGLVDVTPAASPLAGQAPAGEDSGHENAICAFGAAPASAPGPASLVLRLEHGGTAPSLHPAPDQRYYARSIVREQSPRAPPSPV
jgi:hypothetical protein